MVQCQPGALDRIFGALADPTRRAILGRLAAGEASVTTLAAPCDMTVPAVAKHLRVLADAGLITTVKTGRIRHCRLEPSPLRSAAQWLEFYTRFWNEQLDQLGTLVERDRTQEQTWRTTTSTRKRSSGSRAGTGRRGRGSSKR
jgi:DNA-binding transcriptional ArsR family regulator